MSIQKFRIKNFKGIRELKIENLKKINIFVGGNNSRKTTILEALSLLSRNNIQNIRSIINKSLYSNSVEMLDSFYHNFDTALSPEILIERAEEKESITMKKIEGTMVAVDDKVITSSEYMFYRNEKDDIKVKQDKTVPIFFVIDGKNRENNIVYIPADRQKVDIAEIISSLQKNKQIEKIVEILKMYDSNLENIYADGRKVYIDLKTLKQSLPVAAMGGGFVSALIIACNLINETESDKIVLIDEIENGLYKSSLRKLIEYILTTAIDSNIQVFITSHSKEFLEEFYENIEVNKDISIVYKVNKDDEKDEMFIKTYKESEVKELLEEGWDIR